MNEPIDMSHLHIQTFQVMDQAPRSNNHSAYWYRCDKCGHEDSIRSDKLRKAQAGVWELRCKACWVAE